LQEDGYLFGQSNDVRIIATQTRPGKNTLRLDVYWSIIEGLGRLAHDIKGLRSMLGWK
jgi:hypothetical protein